MRKSVILGISRLALYVLINMYGGYEQGGILNSLLSSLSVLDILNPFIPRERYCHCKEVSDTRYS